jgi:GH15 family glucan-1,4-alpha-glucosidase
MSQPGPERNDGFAPIRSYAALGDGRSVALVAKDGALDWLAMPALDGVAVFGALLDPERGGSFRLAPVDEFEVQRRYVPGSNVLETTFTTKGGVVTVRDALTLQDGGSLSWIELVRRVDGAEGCVRMAWEVRPRFDFGFRETRITRENETLVAQAGDLALAFRCWDAGEPSLEEATIAGGFEARPGRSSLFTCGLVERDPIPLPPREEIEIRLNRTVDAWQRWLAFHSYEGPWREAVERSVLALKLLIHAPSGAVAAAATTSLPERIGGDLNWDYRFAWVRDSSLVLDALGALGYREQVHASLSWLLRASESTHPKLVPFYALDGSSSTQETHLDLTGYRGSRPVRNGNAAAGQLQLGCYGDLLETIRLYVRHGNTLDAGTRRRLADVADHVCEIWERPDSGFWELDEQRHYTISKINCWLVLDRAVWLAAHGEAPKGRTARWRREAERLRAWIDERCWSDARRSYTFYADGDELDAAVLLAVRFGYLGPADPRAASTIDAVCEELSAGGPVLYRYTGQREREGAFLACSFWLVDALARTHRTEEARRTMDETLSLANDVGLYSEELDPETGEFLGNFPQGLTHLALVNAAVAVADAK